MADTKATQFEELFTDEFDGLPSLIQRLRVALSKAPTSPQDAVNSVLAEGNIPAGPLAHLQFIQSILTVTNDHHALSTYILDEVEPRGSLPAVAERFFPASASPNITDVSQDVVVAFRSKFFRAYPMAVMLALWKAGKFGADESLKSPMSTLLLVIITENLDMASPELFAAAKALSFPVEKPKAKPTLDNVVELVRAMRRLSDLVVEPEDVPILVKNGYRSVRQIAVLSRVKFASAMASAGIEKSRAIRIHDHAEQIECRNEHIWLSIVQNRRSNFDPVKVSIVTATTPGQSSGIGAGRSHNNLTDIFRLENPACEQCCSVVSLSAYFVDLLRLLGDRNANPLAVATTDPKTGKTELPPKVIRYLLDRRPDLEYLELSCANCQALVPYITLVNEVLESFIKFHATPEGSRKKATIDAFNSSPGDEKKDWHGARQYSAGNTDLKVYEQHISKQMFPFAIFPYNQARDTITQTFASCGLSILDIVETFQSPESLLKDVPGTAKVSETVQAELRRGVADAIERQIASEVLHLQHEDFAAITRETYHPSWLNELVSGLSERGITFSKTSPWSCAGLWGYSSKAEMLETTAEKGLTFVKAQFMRRAGLTFQEVLDLTRTQYFGQQLVLVNESGSKVFSGKIEELRLRCSAVAPPFKPLTDGVCRDLQAFIRLRSRLKWSIKDLDAAIFCLRSAGTLDPMPGRTTLLLQSDTDPDDSRLLSSSTITPDTLKNIAWASRLSQLTGMSVPSLLPLWGDIDTFGDASLYHKVFLHPHVLHVDNKFLPPAQGHYLNYREQVDDHYPGLCAALKWSPEYIDDLIHAAGLTSRSYFDLANVSSLYRHMLVCRILSVPHGKVMSFFGVFKTAHGDVFERPKRTYSAIKTWHTMLESSWTIPEMLRILTTGEAPKELVTMQGAGLKLATTIAEGAVEAEKSLAFVSQARLVTREDVVKVSVRAFDAATSEKIVQFVESTQVVPPVKVTCTTAEIAQLHAITASSAWPKQLTVVETNNSPTDSTVSIELSGTISTISQAQVLESLEVLPNVRDAAASLLASSLVAWNIMLGRFVTTESKSSTRDALESLREDWPQPLPGSLEETSAASGQTTNSTVPEPAAENVSAKDRDSQKDSETLQQETEADVLALETAQKENDQLAADREAAIRQRYRVFVDIALPVLKNDLLESLVLSIVKDLFPDQDGQIIQLLLSDVVRVASLDGQQATAEQALLELATPESDIQDQKACNTYFRPDSTDGFTFHYISPPTNAAEQKSTARPKLSVNGLELIFNDASNSWESCRLTGGQFYLLQADVALSNLQWSTSKALPSALTSNMLFSAARVNRAAGVHRAISRAVEITKSLDINVEELQYINVTRKNTAASRMMTFDFANITLQGLFQLQIYKEMREKSASSPQSLITLFAWLSEDPETWMTGKNVDQIMEHLCNQIASATNWKASRISSALSAKYPKLSPKTVFGKLQDFEEFRALEKVVLMDDDLGRMSSTGSQLPVRTLFELAQPPRVLTVEASFMAVDSMLQLGQPSEECQMKLAQNQRQALVHYLLQQPYILSKGIFDADGLFEYFLIDVQMGPQLRTSRMKQAISSVQLFAQRCLLGLEPGVSKDCLPREKWEWMQQYSLWEANRKLFLYPENWIEPTLRDDKSELFDAFEASLMQKDLSFATFAQAVKAYAYGLNEVASLDIEAYLHDSQPGIADEFHFFGRTRSSPYTFYYRSLRVIRPGDDSYWRPWTKIDLDLSSIEREWNGASLSDAGIYLVPVLHGSRLYLFVPQIVLKTVTSESSDKLRSQPDSSLGKAGTFGSLANAPIKDAAARNLWEVKLGWTELVEGRWSPKKMSPGSIEVAEPLPSISAFTFDPVYDGKTMNMVVGISAGPSNSTKIGQFRFYQDQVSAIPLKTAEFVKQTQPLATEFQKYLVDKPKKSDVDEKTYAYDGKSVKPLMFLPDTGNDDSRLKISWTLSFGGTKADQNLSAFVMSETLKDGRSLSHFAKPRTDTSVAKLSQQSVASGTNLVLLDHTFSHELMEATASRSNPLQTLYDRLSNVSKAELGTAYGIGNRAYYHELSQPSALYNWELGLHAVLLAVDRFFATQQFEEALQVARLVFDPTVDFGTTQPTSGDKSVDKAAASCWRFPPFREIAEKELKRGEAAVDTSILPAEVESAVTERRSHGAMVHATARGRPTAYMKWIIMKYAEILIAAGDIHFRQGTLESLPLATQRYVEAAHVLGPEPPAVPKLGKPVVLTYATYSSLEKKEVDFELSLPFSCELVERGSKQPVDADTQKQNLLCFVRSGYFCVGLNPQFKKMRDLVNERLFNIRNSLDIQGRPFTYALIEPPIDPGALIALSSMGGNQSLGDGLKMIIGDRDSPMPSSRFDSLLRRAIEMCTELRGMGERFLVAIEKREAERFNMLQAKHKVVLQNMMLEVKELQRVELARTAESIRMNRDTHVSQLEFFLTLIGESKDLVPNTEGYWRDIEQDIEQPTSDDLRMNSYEKWEMNLSTAAAALNVTAAAIDAASAPMHTLPTVSTNLMPMGVGATMSIGGSNVASFMNGLSSVLKMSSMIATEAGARSARKAQLTRQLQDRRFQANTHGREIKQLDKQLEIHATREQINAKELALQRAEIEDARQMETWYRTKYTNEQLYGWMERTLRSLHYQAYTLAVTIARRAESALAFEQGRDGGATYLKPGGYWDSSRDGLLAADALYLDLKRMELAHSARRWHDFEITKTVSLRQIDPLALLRLRMTGSTTFSLSEMLFDVDYPGHFIRRLKSVAVSVPAIVGPYTNVNATLTLTEHKYRVRAGASNADDYLAAASAQDNTTDSFRTDRIPIASIAVSSGNHDSGVFELNFRDERFMPFEGAGAISSWRLELPEVRQFDYESISDVVLHVMYTSMDGGLGLRNAASQAVQKQRADIELQGKGEGFFALFDLKNDFSNEWWAFKSALSSSASAAQPAKLPLGALQDRLAFWSRRSKLTVKNIMLVFAPESAGLVGRLKLSCVGASAPWVRGTLGKCITMTCSDLEVEELKGWSFEVREKVERPGDRVFMLLRYVFK